MPRFGLNIVAQLHPRSVACEQPPDEKLFKPGARLHSTHDGENQPLANAREIWDTKASQGTLCPTRLSSQLQTSHLLQMAFQLRYSVIVWVILVGSCNCARQILCDNAGLQWAAFKSGPAGSQYRTFDPNYMKDTSIQGGTGESLLLHSSSTTKIGAMGCPDAKGNVSIYGSPAVIPCNRHTIMLRGYINPSITGTYAVNLHASDQFGFFWLGPRARSGWHRRNHDLEAVFGARWPSQRPSYDGSNATFFYLEAYAYYPIRMIYANDDGGYAYLATIVDPFGNVILGANTGPSPNLVQYSCDGNTAPDWSPWGKEA